MTWELHCMHANFSEICLPWFRFPRLEIAWPRLYQIHDRSDIWISIDSKLIRILRFLYWTMKLDFSFLWQVKGKGSCDGPPPFNNGLLDTSDKRMRRMGENREGGLNKIITSLTSAQMQAKAFLLPNIIFCLISCKVHEFIFPSYKSTLCTWSTDTACMTDEMQMEGV